MGLLNNTNVMAGASSNGKRIERKQRAMLPLETFKSLVEEIERIALEEAPIPDTKDMNYITVRSDQSKQLNDLAEFKMKGNSVCDAAGEWDILECYPIDLVSGISGEEPYDTAYYWRIGPKSTLGNNKRLKRSV